jgi:serine/threonine protein kinase
MIGQLLADRYRVTQVFASETYLASDTYRPDYPLCAVKRWQPDMVLDEAPRLKLLLEKRLDSLNNLGIHPQIPVFRDFFVRDNTIYQVEEFMSGHPLSRELQSVMPWSELRLSRLLQEVLMVLVFAHRQGVIHQDLQPANLIRRQSDGRWGVINWMAVPSSQLITTPVSVYQPPEQRQGHLLFNSDLYALGLIATQALTGTAPENLPAWITRQGGSRWRDRAQVSSKLADLIERLTNQDFRHRYQSAQEALHLLQSAQTGVANVTNSDRQTRITVPPEDQTKPVAMTIATSAMGPQPGRTRAELAKTELAKTELAKTNLAKTNLAKTNLAKTNLAKTNLAKTNLAKTNLAKTNLAKTNLAKTNLAKTDLAKTKLDRRPSGRGQERDTEWDEEQQPK